MESWNNTLADAMKVEIYKKCQKGNCVARVTKYEVRTFLFNHRIPYIQTENEKKKREPMSCNEAQEGF